MSLDFSVVFQNQRLLINGALTTLQLCLLAGSLGTLLGFCVGIIRASRVPVLSPILQGYVVVVRGIPLLMLLFFVYFGLPYVGVRALDSASTVVLAFTLSTGAFVSEIVRAGIESVAREQREASDALGLSRWQSLRHVVLPQATTVALPPLIGFYIGLTKDTSLAFVVGYHEIMRESQYVVDRTAAVLPIYLTVALFYFAICFPLSRLVALLERRRPR